MRAALRSYRNAFVGVGIASGLISLLSLTGPLFMLQIYDRVLASRSVPTLVGLGLIVLVMFGFQGLFEMLRGRVLLRIGRGFDRRLSPRVFDLVVRLPLAAGAKDDGMQPIRDLENVRAFTSSAGLTALFDLPWIPLYIVICFLFHPWMGVAVLLGTLVICSLTLATEGLTRRLNQKATVLAVTRQAFANDARHNAAVVRALGMHGRMTTRWEEANERYLTAQQTASDLVGGFASLSRVLRLIMQAAMLAVGACLVIAQEATAGVMLAATILSARAMAPVELAIANWRPFITARQSWRRLAERLTSLPPLEPRFQLPPPRKSLRVTSATIAPPGAGTPALHDVSFTLEAGTVLGVIGPSGSGKTSLARALVGLWAPVRGTIRIDGATLDQWHPDDIGRSIGYLSQEIDLFDGTVAENIARFEPGADPARLVKAAKAAGVHEMILHMPLGYRTQVGQRGGLLSGGQRQRIALARALFGDPFLVVLDEPNSNLDAHGELALTKALQAVRSRGGIAIVIAHRPSAVSAADYLLIVNEGRMQSFGPRDRILQQLRMAPEAGTSAKVAPGARKP